MIRSCARFIAPAALGLGLALSAGCLPTSIADPSFHSARVGYALGLTYDTDGERLAGGEVEAASEFHGVGIFTQLDVNRLRQDLGEAGVFSRGSAAVGLGLRLSPIGLFTPPGRFRVFRFFDIYGDGGGAVGLATSSNGVTERSEGFAGVGLDLRAGFGRARWFPGVTARYRQIAGKPSYGVEEQVFVGLTWSQSYSAKLHIQD